MARLRRVRGVSRVIKSLQKYRKGKAAGVSRGLVKAGLFLQRQSQKIVPVDTGALKNSARTRKEKDGFDTEVIVSYGTSYAIYVHENLRARHKKGKEAKFLEKPLVVHANEMARIIRTEASK